ncbi:MAG: hypothetical protein ABIF11_10440, partial [Nitrospirota bacterium]
IIRRLSYQTIHTTKGDIGSWDINSTSLHLGSDVTYIGLDPNTGIWMGNETFGNAPFRVNNGGVVTATAGTIGGWTLGTDRFYGGSGNTYIGLIPGTGIQMGNATFGSAPFSVTNAGALKATSGLIGGWSLTNSSLSSDSNTTTANILLDQDDGLIRVGNSTETYLYLDGANKKISTSDFASGALGSGWALDDDTAEFNNIRARGKFTTSVFELESISVVGGNLLVMSGDVLAEDMTAGD